MTTRKRGRAAGPRRPGGERPARQPSQDRGQRRYEQLLDAAEQVIAEVGVEAATTNAIARRAGSGMGSLYRFFPNKEAIVVALAARYKERVRPLTMYAGRPELGALSIAQMVDAIVDPLVEFFRRAPAYGPVFHFIDAPGAQGWPDCDLPETIVANVEAVMAARAPRVPAPQRHIHAMVAVELVHRMLEFAFRQPPRARRAVLAETKRLLALYSEMIVSEDDPLRRLR